MLRRLSQYRINVLENDQAAVEFHCLFRDWITKWVCIKSESLENKMIMMMMILPSKKGMEEDDAPKISFQIALRF